MPPLGKYFTATTRLEVTRSRRAASQRPDSGWTSEPVLACEFQLSDGGARQINQIGSAENELVTWI